MRGSSPLPSQPIRSNMLDRRALIVVLVACVVATVALVPRLTRGPLSPEEYRAELAAALDGFDSSGASGADGLERMAEKFKDAGAQLSDVEPPADAAGAHARLADGLTQFGERLAELAASSGQGMAAYQAELARYGSSGAEWVAALNELAAKGYTSGPIR